LDRELSGTVTFTLWLIKTTLPISWREFEVTSFSQSLIEQGASCIQHYEVTSTYSWEDSVTSVREWAVEIKVSNSNKSGILAALEKSHPYDVPQILVSHCETVQGYGEWINSH